MVNKKIQGKKNGSKCRKIELIFYGYGIRNIYVLDDLELIMENDKTFKATGKISKVEYVTKKYLKKWKKKN